MNAAAGRRMRLTYGRWLLVVCLRSVVVGLWSFVICLSMVVGPANGERRTANEIMSGD